MADPRVFAESGSGDHSPGSQAASSQPPGGPPTPPRRRGGLPRGAIAGLVLAIAVAVVLAGLFAAGVGPFHRNPTSNGSGSVSVAQTYSQARALATQAAQAEGSGPWNVLVASGIDLPAPIVESTTLPSNLLGGSAGSACVGTSEASTSTVTLLGFSGNISLGQAPDWFFLLDGSGGTPLFVGVVGGQANIWEKFSGSECSLLALVGSIPGSIVDSSTAVAAALSDTGTGAGTSFIAAHPGGYLTASAIFSGSWDVAYSTCPTTGNASAGTVYYGYNATVSFTSGAIATGPSMGRTTCSGLDVTGGLA